MVRFPAPVFVSPAVSLPPLFRMDGPSDGEGPVGLVEIGPHEATDLTLPQAGGQLGVEEVVPDTVRPDHIHELLQLSVVQDLLGRGLFSRQDDAVGGVPGNQVFLHRRVRASWRTPWIRLTVEPASLYPYWGCSS